VGLLFEQLPRQRTKFRIVPSEIVSNIASGTSEQAIGLSEIHNGISSLDEVTQKNAGMINESASSSKALMQKSLELQNLVARFDTGRGTARAGAGQSAGSGATKAPDDRIGWSTELEKDRASKTPNRAAAAVGQATELWEDF
jgi:methyl-accepting chemotaxis protein